MAYFAFTVKLLSETSWGKPFSADDVCKNLQSGKGDASLSSSDDNMTSGTVKDMVSSVRGRLLNLARQTRKPFDEVLILYGLERFLFRLSQSAHKNDFILKGPVTDAPAEFSIVMRALRDFLLPLARSNEKDRVWNAMWLPAGPWHEQGIR